MPNEPQTSPRIGDTPAAPTTHDVPGKMHVLPKPEQPRPRPAPTGPARSTPAEALDATIRVAAKLACEDHYQQEHLNTAPPCAGALRDAEYWADKLALRRGVLT